LVTNTTLSQAQGLAVIFSHHPVTNTIIEQPTDVLKWPVERGCCGGGDRMVVGLVTTYHHYWSRTNYRQFFLVFVRLFLCSPIHPFKCLIILNVTNRLALVLDGNINIFYVHARIGVPLKFVKFLIFVTESGGKSTNYRHVRCGKIYI
jgi:hypothetical protein